MLTDVQIEALYQKQFPDGMTWEGISNKLARMHDEYTDELRVVFCNQLLYQISSGYTKYDFEITQDSLEPTVIVKEEVIEKINNPIIKNDETKLNPKYTFENFVVGNSNRFAHAYALSVAEEAGLLISFDPNLRPPLWDTERADSSVRLRQPLALCCRPF